MTEKIDAGDTLTAYYRSLGFSGTVGRRVRVIHGLGRTGHIPLSSMRDHVTGPEYLILGNSRLRENSLSVI